MLLKNAIILNENFEFVKKDIEIEGEKISGIGDLSEKSECIDLSGKIVVPGLIDIHTHGCMGFDFTDNLEKEEMEKMLYFYEKSGITTVICTLATASEQQMKQAVSSIANFHKEKLRGANIGGIHLEGPYFSKKYKGAQNEAYIRKPDIEEFNTLNLLSEGKIRIVSIAPELEGALEFIKEASKSARISIGHTDASEALARQAIEAGAKNLTHSFNGMRPLHHRNPNAIGAALDSEDVYCEFIGDGKHIDKTVLRIMYRLLGDERMVLVSDSIPPSGLPDGEYKVHGHTCIVSDGVGRLPDGTINGGTSTVLNCVKNLISYGILPESAFKMGSLTAARAAGISDVCGSISIGKRADLLIMDKDFNIEHTIIRGEIFE